MQTNKIQIPSNSDQIGLKDSLLDFSSRYHNCNVFVFSDYKILTFETYRRNYNPASRIDRSKIPEDSIRYYVIKPSTQYKPWLVSDDAYNDPGYWWWIMEFNNIFDIEDFEAGRTIKIPPVHVLEKRD